jgi:hypothetical protein
VTEVKTRDDSAFFISAQPVLPSIHVSQDLVFIVCNVLVDFLYEEPYLQFMYVLLEKCWFQLFGHDEPYILRLYYGRGWLRSEKKSNDYTVVPNLATSGYLAGASRYRREMDIRSL